MAQLLHILHALHFIKRRDVMAAAGLTEEYINFIFSDGYRCYIHAGV